MSRTVQPSAKPSHDELQLVRTRHLVHLRGEVLADFETALVEEVHRRVILERRNLASVTASEWLVLDGALEAMLRAPRQDLTDMGLAA